jgi:alkylation response protein AidB-like acyl-CoA dehydrogenase
MIEEIPTEADFHRRWLAVAAPAVDDPARMAVLGGELADRLAWVFMSGYQAAVRSCFPELVGDGWACFAAAEREEGPACTLEGTAGEWRLNGEKSWIAGAGHVAGLVVALGDDRRCFVGVARTSPGVTISLPRAPKFLAELTQGVARFEAVPISAGALLETPERGGWFRGAEPLFVLLALNGCLAAVCRAQDERSELADLADQAIAMGSEQSLEIHDWTRLKPGLAELRSRTAEVVSGFEARGLYRASPALQNSWNADRRLLKMFQVLPG